MWNMVVAVLLSLHPTTSGALAPNGEAGAPGEAWQSRFTWHLEGKLSVRSSSHVQYVGVYGQLPTRSGDGPEHVPETPDPGTSLELSKIAVSCNAEITPDIRAAVKVHLLDLYDRNPTSSDDRIFLREAWVQLGRRDDAMNPSPGHSLYLLVGKAPRFTKQRDRRLESYGLLGNAVGRFEQVQVQAGGGFGRHLYWRAHLANPNPLFFRDPNALAGDNGTPDAEGGSAYGTGFVMLYDAKAVDISFSGQIEAGGGAGLRFISEDGSRAIDSLGWYFHRKLADRQPLRGTSISGDLALLLGGGFPLPFSGRDKTELGFTTKGRFHDFRFHAQVAQQDIAGLKRRGYELELAYFFELPGLCASGDTPVVNWIQPALRYSAIDNLFTATHDYPYPAIAWDWIKLDFGFRLGIIRGVDVTVEYSRHSMKLEEGGVLHPDEFLTTLRVSH